MVTKDSEYTMLKQEIISLVELQNTYIIAMYTITITILGVAFERKSEILFLLPYVVLFSFQRIISVKRDGMLRISSYIAVYLEEGEGWESKYEEIFNRTTRRSRKRFSKFTNIFIGRISSLQLGLLCSASSIIMHFYNKIKLLNLNSLELQDVLVVLSSIILFTCLNYSVKDIFKSKRKQYIRILKE